MSSSSVAEAVPSHNSGWRVTFAALGMNLAFGILYTWSVLGKGVPDSWNWTQSDRSLPYAVACLVFCLVMVPSGRWQDQYGPRVVASFGGVLGGIGLLLASFTTTPWGYVIGFGVLAGAGLGCGYASATPPAVKWFPSARTGTIAGIVVSGFGLASVYAAPLSQWLIQSFGMARAVEVLGIGFFVIVVGLAQFLKTPPPGFRPATTGPGNAAAKPQDFLPRETLGTWQFYALWFLYACGAGAGLMIISKLAAIADLQAGQKLGFLLVAALAIGNGAGRVIAGMASDRIGRKTTLFVCLVFQAVLIVVLSRAVAGSALAAAPVLAVLSALIGANYGANLSLFPSLTKDFYGLKHFGTNYGLVFTSWGVGGFTLSLLAGKVYDQTKSFHFAYICSAALLAMAAAVTLFLKTPQAPAEEAV